MENIRYKQSVTAVVIRAGKVLLARHTYGAGKNMLIVPGGYLNKGETPEHAVKREIFGRNRCFDKSKGYYSCQI